MSGYSVNTVPHHSNSFRNDTHHYITNALSFCNHYNQIIDAYLSDYFVKNHIEKIQSSWIPVLRTMTPPDLAMLLENNDPAIKTVWPLSLLAFKKSCDIYSLDRKAVNSVEKSIREGIKPEIESNDDMIKGLCSQADCDHSDVNTNGNIKDGQYLVLEHCYRKHVKPKKQHEITNLGQALNTIATLTECSNVVDIGAGQGHLSRILAFGYGLDVTTVEAADCHAPKAKKFDSEVKTDIEKGKILSHKKKKKTSLMPPENVLTFAEPLHVTARIDPSVSAKIFLQEIITARQKKQTSQDYLPNKCIGKVSICNTAHMDPKEYIKENKVSGLSKKKTVCYKNGATTNEMPRKLAKNYTDCDNVIENNSELELSIDSDNHCINCSSVHRNRGCSRNKDALLTENGVFTDDIDSFILTGLHACGDLSPTMLRVFIECPKARAIASVACCYMKLSTLSGENIGYPMSKYVQGLENHHLSYEAREMACHCTDTYCNRLRENSSHLKSHVYRCALQEVIQDKDPNIQHGCIRLALKNVTNMSFTQYASLALPRLGLDGSLTESQLDRAEQRLTCWKDVVAFFTIRLCLAPVVETIILLDRVLYLQEQGVSSCLLPIFDPMLSPRNFVLIAKKDL